jgi:hypothetical protein
MKQTTFASLAWHAKGRTTRRERFLAEMNAVVPWARLLALIEPHHPKAGRAGRPSMPLERMQVLAPSKRRCGWRGPRRDGQRQRRGSVRRRALH